MTAPDFQVTLPANIEAARGIYNNSYLVKQIVDVNAEKEGVSVDEYLCTVAGGTVSATPAEMGFVGEREAIEIDVTLEGLGGR